MADLNLPAIALGGVLALLGTIVSQVFGLLSGFLDRRYRRRQIRREKLEQMADAVSQSAIRLGVFLDAGSLEEMTTLSPLPYGRSASIIALLYFPRLFNAASNYENKLADYFRFARKCFQTETGSTLYAKILKHPDATKHYDSIMEAREKLDYAIADESRHHPV